VLRRAGAFFRYRGSLTTPRCSEGVRWLVPQDALEASGEQVAAFRRVRRAERAAAAGSERPLAGLGSMIAGNPPETATATGRKSSVQDCSWPLDRLNCIPCRDRTGCCAIAIPLPP